MTYAVVKRPPSSILSLLQAGLRIPSTQAPSCTCIRDRLGQHLCKLSVRASLSGATDCAFVP